MYEPKMPLRDYQQRGVDKTMDFFRSGKRSALMVIPTGGGKTRMVNEIIRLLMEIEESERPRINMRPSVFCAHRDKLIQQIISAFRRDIPGYRIGREVGTETVRPGELLIAASVPTIGRDGSNRMPHVAETGTKIFVIDEAHHAGADGYVYAAGKYSHSDGLILGVTATNHRLDQKQIVRPDGSALFEAVTEEISLLQGIQEKWLCNIRCFQVMTDVDISTVGSVGDDFNSKALDEKVDTETRTQLAIDKWEEVGMERRTLMFCTTINHAVHASRAFKKRGHKFEFVHSQQSHDLNELYLGQLERHEIDGICNVGVLTEGYDCPPISCIIMGRPTKSWTLYCQMVGRGTRIHPEKQDLIVIDMVDLAGRHKLIKAPEMVGLPDIDLEGDTVTEALEKIEKAKREGRKIAEAKTMQQVKTALVEVDILTQTRLSPDVKRMSDFAWIRDDKMYKLHSGDGETFVIKPDTIGNWRMTMHTSVGSTTLINSFGSTDVPAWSRVDSTVRWMVRDDQSKLANMVQRKGTGQMNRSVMEKLATKGGLKIQDLKQLDQSDAQVMLQRVLGGYRK